MTWQELLEYIQEMPPRFLNTTVHIFDCSNGVTHLDAMFTNDCNDDDYMIDLDQPQIWVNFSEDFDVNPP